MLKRLLDLTIASIVMIVLLPLLLAIAILVRTKLGSPVLFAQTRVGKNERLFSIYKFRTMSTVAGDNGQPLPDSQRMTVFGSFLRKSSLDELPELFNIICGNMSLVGPRPLLPEYLELYNDRQRRRHEVRPGLTGLAQVCGRNSLDWQERFEKDVWYIENHSLLLDLQILIRTIAIVFSQSGVSAENQVTMTRFTGSDPSAAAVESGSQS